MPIKTCLTGPEIQRMIEVMNSPRDKLIISFYADSVPGNSPVVLKNDSIKGGDFEIISFEELWNRLPPAISSNTEEEIKIPDSPIWILDYVPRGRIYTRLKYIIRHPYSGSILKINTHTGIVDVSPNHSIYAGKTPTGVRLMDAKEVKEGYFLSQLDWNKVRDSNYWFLGGIKLAWLYGFFYAEGSACTGARKTYNSYRVSFSNNDKELLLQAEDIFTLFFGNKMIWGKREKNYKITGSCSKGLYDFFRELFYNPDGTKKVPSVILNAPRKEKLAFLQGYNLGDGRQNPTNMFQSFTTNSPVGAAGLLWLAVSLGNTKYNLDIREDKPTITTINFCVGKQRKSLKQVKRILQTEYKGFLYDLGTESHTFITGVGLIRVHNTGCRVSELLTLTVDQVDFDTREALIRHLKRGIKKKCPVCERIAGRHTPFCSRCGANLSQVEAEGIEERRRIIGLGQETIDLLKEHTRGMLGSDMIINLSRQQVYNIVREAAERAGIKGKAILNPETGKRHFVHPHDFRAALATDWLQMAKGDVEKQKALQEHLGHKIFDTTVRYERLQPTRVKGIEDEVRNKRFAKIS